MQIERQKYTMDELQVFANYFNSGKTLKETAEHFNVKYDTLKTNLTKHGFRTPIRKQSKKNISENRINFNENYFEFIDSHQKAYFLGLLFSDGYICSTVYETSKQVGIALQLSDKYILEYFTNELNILNSLKVYKNSIKLVCTSEKMYNDLVKLGLKERKSNLDFTFPNIPEEFYESFILGYFDGDGCISIKQTGAIVVTICCNSEKFLKDMSNILNNCFNIETNIRMEQGVRKNPLYILNFKGRKNHLKLKEIFYRNCPVYLDRKYKKFMEIPC